MTMAGSSTAVVGALDRASDRRLNRGRGRGSVRWLLALAALLPACAPAAPPQPANAGGSSAAPAAPPAASQPAVPTSAPAPAALPATAAAPSTAVQPLSPPVKVRMGALGIAPEAGLYVAQERGYFREEGLDVEFVPFRGSADLMAPLATGELQMGDGGPDPSLFNAVQRDIGVKIVGHNALAGPGDASAALVVRKDLVDSGQFRDVPDFKGL